MRVLTQEEKKVKVESFLEKTEHHWEENKVIKKLWNEVDWNQSVFHKEYGGLWQFTNDGNYKWIAYNPIEQAHKDWAEQYYQSQIKTVRYSINIIYYYNKNPINREVYETTQRLR